MTLLQRPKKRTRDARKAVDLRKTVKQGQAKLADILATLDCGCTCRSPSSGHPSCFLADTLAATFQHGLLAMGEMAAGMLVKTYVPQERLELGTAEPPPLDRSDLCLVRLVMGRPGGHRVDIELVRRRSWLAEHPAQPGGAVLLDMHETLKTLTGTTVAERISKRPESETIYNIEVEGDHVYRVDVSGVLVHNTSVLANCCAPPSGSYDPLGTEGVQFNGQTVHRATGVTAYITPAMVGQTLHQKAIG